MIKIAICDDSSYMRKKTKNSLIKYAIQKNVEFQMQEYETGEELLEAEKAQEQIHDLIFMDYEFEEKGQNGLEIIKNLRMLQKQTKVIFLSSYAGIVFQSFEVNPFRFLVKPLQEEKLFQAMDVFLETIAISRTRYKEFTTALTEYNFSKQRYIA